MRPQHSSTRGSAARQSERKAHHPHTRASHTPHKGSRVGALSGHTKTRYVEGQNRRRRHERTPRRGAGNNDNRRAQEQQA